MEAAPGAHRGHWKTEAGGQEAVGGVGGAVRSHRPAGAEQGAACCCIRPPEGAAVEEGQQSRGEVGKRGERAAAGCLGMGVVEEGCCQLLVVVEAVLEGEQSPAWPPQGIRWEELAVGGSG